MSLHKLFLRFSPCVVVFVLSSVSLLAQERTPAPQAGTPASAPPSVSPTLKLREELIGEVSPDSKVEMARSTENHLAWVEKKGGERIVKLDGKQVGGVYQDASFLRFSEDEQHLAFTAKRNSKWVLVLDGQERSKEYGRLTAPSLSKNGKFFAVAGCREKRCRLIVNGDEMTPEFDDVSAPRFTSNGEHYGYFAKRDKKWVLMLDNQEFGPEMNMVISWWMDPDGKRVAVAGLIDKNWTWVVDKTPGPGFDVIGDIAFSPDYKHFAYGGTDAKWGFSKNKTHGVIVVDGKVAGEYEGRGFGGSWQGMFGASTQIAPGLRNLSPDFHGVSDPQYTPDGKLVYAGRRGEDNVVVMIDGAAGPPFEDIVSPIAISTEGNHVFYVGKRGDSFVEVRDQKAGASFPGKRAESFVGLLMISNDGAHLAYEIVRGGKQFMAGNTTRALRRVVVDGQAGPEYDALGLRDLNLRAEGKRYHYAVIGAEGTHDRVVFNGLETKLYDDVFSRSVEFVDDQTIDFVAQDGQRFIRVTAVME
ncbi:MAG: hypothetical protein LAO24_06390 [Acidobacteriia bacterium]|nr:hypothetical protein [Terriglobia bacterium]